MDYFHPYSYHKYYPMFSSGIHQYMHWPSHFLPPIQTPSQLPVTSVVASIGGPQETTGQTEFHFFYGAMPIQVSVPPWHYNQPLWSPPVLKPPPGQRLGPVNPNHSQSLGPVKPNHSQPLTAPWPDGSTLRGELRWGRLERVYGPRRELPDFVKEDLRRVYGTYPRTDVSISFQGGEFVVHGDPRVGEQEYRVEKTVVRQLESPEADSVRVTVEQRTKKRAKRRVK